MSVLTSRRKASVAYRCGVCGGMIKSGSLYLRHFDTVDKTTVRECSRDATMFGRAGLLEQKEKERK